MRRLVLIEFTTATEKRAVGDQLNVDKGSAVSFCDRLKVAERVGQAAPAAVAPVPVVDVEPVAIPPVDVDADY